MEKLGDSSRPESAVESYKLVTVDQRVSKAIEEEESFLEYIQSLPAMSNDNVEAFKKKQVPVLMRSTSEFAGGLDHLENLYKLMEHLGQLRKQNSKLQKRVKYLENIAQDEMQEAEVEDSVRLDARRKRSTKCKSGYGIRHSLIRSSRERSRSVGVDEFVKSRQVEGIKSKVSKWSKVKEAFRWEKVILPEVASQDSGIGGAEYLRVPSDQSSFSVSPADSVLSGPQPLSSTSTSEDELELDNHPTSSAGRKRYGSSVDGGSQMRLGSEDQETRRSKSLDGDAILSQSFIIEQHSTTSKDCKSNQYNKSHKTPWSKVKDIIQTRTGSVKKKRMVENDFDEEVAAPEEHSGSEDNKDLEDKLCDSVIPSEENQESSESFLSSLGEVSNKKRLAPVLTITLPSTEELRSHEVKPEVGVPTSKSAKPPPSPQLEERHPKLLMKQRTLDETTHKDHYKKQMTSSSAGTSPPTPRRQSKWTKVKNAFLTSTPSPEDMLNHASNSVPSSPVKTSSFTYDLESDDLSSGEFVDDNLRDNNDDDVFPESMEESFSTNCDVSNENIHSEIKKNFEELQLRLSHEFHQKLTEWERLKYSGSGIVPSAGRVGSSGMSSGTSSIGEDDRVFRRKMEEWDKIKSPKQREVTLHLGEENLSPDFKKKLEQWEKLKSIPISPTPESSPNVQPQFKKKITEWQRWRSSSSKAESHTHSSTSEFPEDFSRKLMEWEKMKQNGSDTDNQPRVENRSPSPSMSRKDYIEQKSKKLQQRTSEIGYKVMKSKSHNEEKELAWLEKELHKIEREKIRLERERDKYLEREARLEKMRKAIGSTQLKQEILIPTSTGLFRFQGISQKFTRKLYEWEKARGIGPEASTFALLDPGYKPPLQSGQNSVDGGKKNGTMLLRSKSVGSVVDVASNGGSPGGITHQPSSLSLNNVDDIESSGITCGLEQQTSQGELCESDMEEPQAVIVDVEDVIEETASPLMEQPIVVGETPVYSYAPDEVTHLIDSSGSDNEISGGDGVQSSYIIIQENINLLDKLQKKEDICRKIENKMENLEEEMNTTARKKEKQLESLERVDPSLKILDKTTEGDKEDDKAEELKEIKAQLQLLEQHQEQLRHEEKTLQYSFVEHSEQQAVLAQNLVDKMRQLQEVNSSMSSTKQLTSSSDNTNFQQQEALAKVQDLTSQLLCMAEKLEVSMGERSKEMWRFKDVMSRDRISCTHSPLSHHSFSTDSITTCSGIRGLTRLPRQSSEELSKLPALLTNKVLELKRGLSYLCAVSDVPSSTEADDLSEIKNASLANIVEDYKYDSTNPKNYDGEYKSSSLDKCEFSVDKNLRKENLENESAKVLVNDNQPSVESLSHSLLKKKRTQYQNENEQNYFADETEDKDSDSETLIVPVKKEEGKRSTIYDGNKLLKSKSYETYEKKLNQRKYLSQEINQENKKCDIYNESVIKRAKRTRRAVASEKVFKSELQVDIDDETFPSEEENFPIDKKLMNKNGGIKKKLKTRINFEDGSPDDGVERNLEIVSPEVMIDDESTGRRFSADSTSVLNEFNWKVNDSNKGHKTFSETMNQLTKSVPNYDSTANANDIPVYESKDNDNQKAMKVNVFVPTTRKIFSPVRRDSKGKTSSVISYVVKESTPGDQTGETIECNEEDLSNEFTSQSKEQENTISHETSDLNNLEESDNTREEIHFIMPPCWILRETRAQSASPALQRRRFSNAKRRDSQTENTETLNKKIGTDNKEFNNIKESSDNNLTHNPGSSGKRDSNLNKSKTPPLLRKERYFNKDNSSTESSTEFSNMPDSKAINPIRKSRTEVGFPPISPIPGRREVKLANKEAAPSIRMMIARYNRKVSESQELAGSKSPETGSVSPVAWRSPGTERRVKAQMEKYQEEIRKVIQGTSAKRRGISGEVKKSASTSLIRSWDKCGLQDGFNRRPSDGIPDRPNNMNYRGILKSSSAGSIKSSNPVTPKPDENTEDGNNKSENASNLPAEIVTHRDIPESFNFVSIPTPSSFNVNTTAITQNESSIYPQSSPETSRLRALRLKKAKEEFLLRGPGGSSWSCDHNVEKSDTVSPDECVARWTKNKCRLSQISCESDCSYEGILVSGDEQRQDSDTRLLVKSASAGMINIDSSALSNILPQSLNNNHVPSCSNDVGTIPKSNRFGFSHLASRFRKVRMRRHKEKDKDSSNKMETVSALCRQSLLIDLQRSRSTDRKDSGPSSKSCPASPVLQKRDSTSSWIMKRQKIFKPK